MGFFKDLNLARAIMLGSVLLSLVLAYAGWFGVPAAKWPGHVQVAEMRDNLDGRVENLSREISRLSRQHTELSRAVSKEGLTKANNPMSYIMSIAAEDYVELGNVEINPRERDTQIRSVVDKTWEIKADPSRDYQRSQISNFLYQLEAKSRRVKVTDLKIENFNKRVKNHEIPADEWTFDATVTSREAREE